MIPLSVVCKDPLIVLVDGALNRWHHAQRVDDLRTWRALGVYLFDCAAALSQEKVIELGWVASDHDTLAALAMQHCHELQPSRLEDTFA
jgi:hypothetical protein